MRDTDLTVADGRGRERASEDSLKSLVKIARILDCFSTVSRTLSLGELGATSRARSGARLRMRRVVAA